MFLSHTTPDQALQVAASVAGACRLNGRWCSEFQPYFLNLIFRELLDINIDFHKINAIDVDQAQAIFQGNIQRRELIELLVLTEMMLNPIPEELERSLEHWAQQLNVHDRALTLARDVAGQARAQAQSDFYRLFWMGEEDREQQGFEELLKQHGPQAWTFTVEENPDLAT